MKNLKTLLIAGTMIALMTVTSITSFAATTYKTPAQLVAEITGKTEQEVINERNTSGKTYGEIAAAAGKLSQYTAANIEMKKANLNEQVASGKISREKADSIIASLEANSANCDGTGSAQIGRKSGARFGSNGTGLGNGGASRGTGAGRGMNGGGAGMGRGAGNGMGRNR